MPSNKKNLLEAFRDAGQAESEPEAPPPPPEPPPRRQTPVDLPRPELPVVPSWLPWVAGIVLAFVVGVVVGQGLTEGSDEVQGKENEEMQTVDETPQRGAGLVPRPEEAPLRVAEPPAVTSALLDPANVYTVVAATYGSSRQDFAWATHDHLKANELPVFPPVDTGKDILILVGAEPTVGALEETERKLRGLASWDGTRGAFSDAYVARIANYIDR